MGQHGRAGEFQSVLFPSQGDASAVTTHVRPRSLQATAAVHFDQVARIASSALAAAQVRGGGPAEQTPMFVRPA